MKKVVLLALLLTVGLGFGQGKKTLKWISDIKKEWIPNKNGVPEYVKTYENLNLSKEILFTNSVNHLNFGTDFSITILEKNNNHDFIKIKLKTLAHVNTDYKLYAVYWGKIDFKENKMRIALTLSKWENKFFGEIERYDVAKRFPISNNDYLKNLHGKGFYKAHKKISAILLTMSTNIIKHYQEPKKTNNW
ncbi:MAG: hypothetical protein COA88_15495 [Kordia sp.]|nr:MAG: hypothetical protein COA88_15495 [Kordia sp.]